MPVQLTDSRDERTRRDHPGLRLLLAGLLAIVVLGPVAYVHWSASPVFCGPFALFGPNSRVSVVLSNVTSTITSPGGSRGTWRSKQMLFNPRGYDGGAFRITNKRIWKLGLVTIVQR